MSLSPPTYNSSVPLSDQVAAQVYLDCITYSADSYFRNPDPTDHARYDPNIKDLERITRCIPRAVLRQLTNKQLDYLELYYEIIELLEVNSADWRLVADLNKPKPNIMIELALKYNLDLLQFIIDPEEIDDDTIVINVDELKLMEIPALEETLLTADWHPDTYMPPYPQQQPIMNQFNSKRMKEIPEAAALYSEHINLPVHPLTFPLINQLKRFLLGETPPGYRTEFRMGETNLARIELHTGDRIHNFDFLPRLGRLTPPLLPDLLATFGDPRLKDKHRKPRENLAIRTVQTLGLRMIHSMKPTLLNHPRAPYLATVDATTLLVGTRLKLGNFTITMTREPN